MKPKNFESSSNHENQLIATDQFLFGIFYGKLQPESVDSNRAKRVIFVFFKVSSTKRQQRSHTQTNVLSLEQIGH